MPCHHISWSVTYSIKLNSHPHSPGLWLETFIKVSLHGDIIIIMIIIITYFRTVLWQTYPKSHFISSPSLCLPFSLIVT